MATKKNRVRNDNWRNMVIRVPPSMVDELDVERKRRLLSDRSTLVRQILRKELDESNKREKRERDNDTP